MNITKQQKTMVAVLLAGALLAVLNQTLLTPALPTIMEHLSVSATTVQWLTSGYSLVEAVVIPLNAYLLGRFSSRKLFVGGISLFTVGSILCAVAPSFAFLLLGRICQATATGVVMPAVFTLILLIFPREQRGGAMGLIGLVISFAPAVGPAVSGALVDTIGWRALFVLVAALALAVVVVSACCLKNFEGFERTTFDVVSVILLALGMVSLLYGLSTFTSAENLAVPAVLMAAGLALLALFAWRQWHLDNPILRIRVLAHREFRTATAVITLLEAVLIGSSVILPMYIQNALGQSATMSGLLMLPGAVIGAVCGLLAGRMFDKRGVRGVTIAGACILLAGVAGYFVLGTDASPLLVCGVYTVACVGLQALITPLNTWGINSLPNSAVPHGNAIVSTMEQVGSSFGTAFVVSLTALSWLVVPAGSAQSAQAYGGCHMAFLGVLGLAAAIAVLIVFFVRDKRKARVGGKAAGGVPAAAAVEGGASAGGDLLVSHVMNSSPDTLDESSTVRDAIVAMQRTETSGLPIVRGNGTVAGFISDGDILKGLSLHNSSREDGDGYYVLPEWESLRERLDAMLGLPALQLATKNVVAIDADASAETAFKMLSEKRIKKMPVLRDGLFVGTLSRRNIMKALAVE